MSKQYVKVIIGFVEVSDQTGKHETQFIGAFDNDDCQGKAVANFENRNRTRRCYVKTYASIINEVS